MYRSFLSTLALGLVLAVLVAALPATNNKRDGISDMIDGIAHVPDAVLGDKDIATASGVGQATVVTPSPSSVAKPTPTAGSSSTPVQSPASSTPTAKAQHAAESPSPAKETPEPTAESSSEPSKAPSKTEPEAQPKASPTAMSDEEQMNPMNILKSVGKFLGMTS